MINRMNQLYIQIHSQSKFTAACGELLELHLAHNLPSSRYDCTLQWAIKCFGASNWKCDSFTLLGNSNCGWHVLCWHLRVNTAGYVAVCNWELHYAWAGISKPVPQCNYSFKLCPVCLFGKQTDSSKSLFFFCLLSFWWLGSCFAIVVTKPITVQFKEGTHKYCTKVVLTYLNFTKKKWWKKKEGD